MSAQVSAYNDLLIHWSSRADVIALAQQAALEPEQRGDSILSALKKLHKCHTQGRVDAVSRRLFERVIPEMFSAYQNGETEPLIAMEIDHRNEGTADPTLCYAISGAILLLIVVFAGLHFMNPLIREKSSF